MFRKKPPKPPPETPATEPPPVVWHPVASATIYGWSFKYESASSIGEVHVSRCTGTSPFATYESVWFLCGTDLRVFAEAALKFADHIDGLKSFTETPPKRTA